ncbi:MAG: flagellar biosynthesis protein FlhA, partial [Spirochaetaceae bacterium]|jgi:flagellar biosynthesis protein FlhA|nr:flagellar biosynthesis protein FlhA [Spirochaetaceae bacterium]
MEWYIVFDTGIFIDENRLKTVLESTAANIGRDVDEVVMRRAPELLGRDEVQAILDMAEEKYPVVTGEVKSLLSLGSVRDIFRGLLSEHVSIRNLPVILETLADWGSFGPAPGEIVIEQIRLALKRQICQEYARGTNIKALTLEPKLDERLADRAMLHEGEEGLWDRCIDAFSPAIKGMEENNLPPVIICSPGARTWVKELTRKKFPGLAVLSYIEIPPDFNVEPVGEIRLSDGTF